LNLFFICSCQEHYLSNYQLAYSVLLVSKEAKFAFWDHFVQISFSCSSGVYWLRRI